MSTKKDLEAENSKLQKKLEAYEQIQNKNEALRTVKSDQKVWHDLFRLENTKTRKNMSYHDDEKMAIWVDVEHKHHFHTHDSKGKKQKFSAPGAGHFHEVIVTEKVVKDADGNEQKVLVGECGPPMVMHNRKPHAYKNDDHRHDVSYIFSEEIEVRKPNEDAVRMMNFLSQEEKKAQSGVSGILA